MDWVDLIFLTDSYKVTHARQYPPNTSLIYSNLRPRYCSYQYGDIDEVVFFGLQYYLREYLTKPVTWNDVSIARSLLMQHFGADVMNIQGGGDYEGWNHLLTKYDGLPPVQIKAVPEGSVVPLTTPVITVENTDPKLAWLTNYLETLLVLTWYPSTVASISRLAKKTIHEALTETGNPDLIDYKLHDFGFRGASSVESAAIGGAAHLVNFKGTDTLIALPFLMRYYEALMPGNSIPASEHSTITTWGKAHEVDAFRNMLEQYPTGLVACVSDSYDITKACRDYWGKSLKEKILSRNGTLVIRPDSGDPVTTLQGVFETLEAAFGSVKNDKGFKVLPPQVRVIQGDGVNPISIRQILGSLRAKGWSADNIAFGMGGALLQQCNRDTLGFAFKCSYTERSGVTGGFPVTKEAPGKNSPGGRFGVRAMQGQYEGCLEKDIHWPDKNYLEPVFLNGHILRHQNFDEIRRNACLP